MISAVHLTQRNLDLLNATAALEQSIRFSVNSAPVELPIEEIYSYFLAQKLSGNEIGRFVVDGMLSPNPETLTRPNGHAANSEKNHPAPSAEDWAQSALAFLNQCTHNKGFDTSNPTTVAFLRYSLAGRPPLYTTEQDRASAANLLDGIPEEHSKILDTLLVNATNMSVELLERARNTAKGYH